MKSTVVVLALLAVAELAPHGLVAAVRSGEAR